MARAQLRLLAHELQRHGAALAGRRHGGLHLVRAVARDHHGRTRIQLRCGRQHMAQQRAPRQALKDFGQAAFHARALARGHDDEIQRCCHR